MGEDFRPVAPVDPTNLRPMLFLDVARQIMLSPDWTHRAASIVLESHTGPGRFSFYGANHPDNIDRVHDRQVDVSILNPAAMLTMAHRGTGLYDRPRDLAVIAMLPHDDRLGFAVADRLGFRRPGRHRGRPVPAAGVGPRLDRRLHAAHGRRGAEVARLQPGRP